jgi:N-methylhydantoinase A/oxoprolinase/acetone carboxylase beta subunit/uncharacterized 2Fe-2S/4Fe-4S cluster protein (DUF4445 family)
MTRPPDLSPDGLTSSPLEDAAPAREKGQDYFIGIDTGGTHTDGVLLDSATRTVLASAKADTTHDDLSQGITRVLEMLDVSEPARVRLVGISSTLATNSIAEGKGRPVGLALIGYDPELISEFGLGERLPSAEIEYFHGGHNGAGEEREPLDLEALTRWVRLVRDDVEAIAVSSYFSPLEPSHERWAREAIAAECDLPVVLGHQLSTRLDSVKRAATAALNASLVAVMTEFIAAVRQSLERLRIDAPLMIVRGDGSLVPYEEAVRKPVETVVSGPAASAVGGHFFSSESAALVIDMGGTTTDIALVEDSQLAISDVGAEIGMFATAVQAARVTTLSVGGDSRIDFGGESIRVGPERVVPLCRLAAGHPGLGEDLARLHTIQPRHRKLTDLEYWFTHEEIDPAALPWLTGRQKQLLALLGPKPLSVTHVLNRLGIHHEVQLGADRLFQQGLIQRAAPTPTDVLHVTGEMIRWSEDAAMQAIGYAASVLDSDRETIAQGVIDILVTTIAERLIAFLAHCSGARELPESLGDPWGQWLMSQAHGHRTPYLGATLHCELPIVGIGAPAEHLLERVAGFLQARFVLPSHHAVANAAGAVAGSVAVRKEALLYTRDTQDARHYRVQANGKTERFDELDEAQGFARDMAAEAALDAAADNGAVDPQVTTSVETDGAVVRFRADAVGTPELAADDSGEVTRALPTWQGTAAESTPALEERPLLTVLPGRESIRLREGETVHDGLARLDTPLSTPCNGEGICGKCGVWVQRPERVAETPHPRISHREARRGLRLACKLVPQEDLIIQLRDLQAARVHSPILPGDAEDAFPTDPFPGELNPAVRVRAQEGGFTVAFADETEWLPLPHFTPSHEPKGLAIDLGTTTLVASLLSLRTGERLGSASALNPQVRYGHDVISRIQHGSTREGLGDLAQAVRKELNELVANLCASSGSEPDEILDVVIGANTTMLQLALEMDPAPLGRLPFRVDVEGNAYYPASAFGLEINPVAKVFVPPVVHAFVGSDITAGLVAIQRYQGQADSSIFVDIGTNGEIVLKDGDRHIATSAAAGPAFEGMGLRNGMRAVNGALRAVSSQADRFDYQVVGDTSPRGICGSGFIDLSAALCQAHALEPSGRLIPRDDANGEIPAFVARELRKLDGVNAFSVTGSVAFTQQDVRQIQLAKSAICTAIETVLDKRESPALPEQVIIGGSFGSAVSARSMERIGMIPARMGERVVDAGNTSLRGSEELLRDVSLRGSLEGRLRHVEHIALEQDPDYMERYVSNMEFPVNV